MGDIGAGRADEQADGEHAAEKRPGAGGRARRSKINSHAAHDGNDRQRIAGSADKGEKRDIERQQRQRQKQLKIKKPGPCRAERCLVVANRFVNDCCQKKRQDKSAPQPGTTNAQSGDIHGKHRIHGEITGVKKQACKHQDHSIAFTRAHTVRMNPS